MKTRQAIFIPAALLAAALLLPAAPALAQADDASLQELREQLAATRRELDQIQQRLGSIEPGGPTRAPANPSQSLSGASGQSAPRVISRNRSVVRSSNGNGNSLFVSRSPRPMIGVVLHTVEREKGVKLAAVTPGAPADKAGLKAGDVLLTLNNEDLSGRRASARVYELLDDMSEGDEYEFTYRREGEEQSATVVAELIQPSMSFSFSGNGQGGGSGLFNGSNTQFDLGLKNFKLDLDQLKTWAEARRDQSIGLNDGRWRDFANSWVEGNGGPVVWNLAMGWSSLQLAELNPSLAEYFGTEEGVLVIDSALENADLKGGDVITHVDGAAVATPSEAMRILTRFDENESVSLTLVRHGGPMDLTLQTPSASPGDFSFGYHYSTDED